MLNQPTHTHWNASLIDRLVDEDINAQRDAPLTPRQARNRIVASLMRDLNDLLNTRSSLKAALSRPEDSPVTLLDFGLAEFSGLHSIRTEEFRELLLECLHNFEPRLSDVHVEIVSTPTTRIDRVQCLITARIGTGPDALTLRLPTEMRSDGIRMKEALG